MENLNYTHTTYKMQTVAIIIIIIIIIILYNIEFYSNII